MTGRMDGRTDRRMDDGGWRMGGWMLEGWMDERKEESRETPLHATTTYSLFIFFQKSNSHSSSLSHSFDS